VIRRCDGTDPNLVRSVVTPIAQPHLDGVRERLEMLASEYGHTAAARTAGTGDPSDLAFARADLERAAVDYYNIAASLPKVLVPCTCGRTFDDVRRSTVYPHESI